MNSYFTNSTRFAPDPEKKKHWILQQESTQSRQSSASAPVKLETTGNENRNRRKVAQDADSGEHRAKRVNRSSSPASPITAVHSPRKVDTHAAKKPDAVSKAKKSDGAAKKNSEAGSKKPRWVDVIAVAMRQLMEQTGRRSFKVAEVADQIAKPSLDDTPQPAIKHGMLTENWRGALNSYFTKSSKFMPDPERKSHWILYSHYEAVDNGSDTGLLRLLSEAGQASASSEAGVLAYAHLRAEVSITKPPSVTEPHCNAAETSMQDEAMQLVGASEQHGAGTT